MTSAQAIAIGQPLVTGGLTLVLANNKSYAPIAARVGADLSTANYTDLTVAGINAVVGVSVANAGGTPALAAVVSAALDAGLAGYLEAVGESALKNDPNAQLVLQALGTSISSAAAAVQGS